MSSSRRGSEESILSMLERDTARKRRRPGGSLVLYGTAALLVAGMVGTVSWLARDNQGQQQIEPILVAKPTPMVAMAEAAPPAAAHAEGAAIIDNPEPPPLGTRAPAPAAAPAPTPLVLVQPGEPVPAANPDPVAEAAPARPAAAPAKPVRSGAARARAAKATAKSQPQLRRAQPAKKGKPSPGHAGVDTDVALISAIISHSAKRAADGEPDSGQ